MSPLLFVIGMKYLFRLMIRVSLSSLFNFHPRCRKLSLNHLAFADDLMLFSKGTYNLLASFGMVLILLLLDKPFFLCVIFVMFYAVFVTFNSFFFGLHHFEESIRLFLFL